jgi:UrcA family protein
MLLTLSNLSRSLEETSMTAATFKTVSNRVNSRRLTVLAGCLLAGTLSVAQAASPEATAVGAVPTMVVSYGDLNLSTTEGNATLLQRITTAARRVCPLEDSRNLARAAYSNSCRAEAVARAVHDINSPQLAALAVRSNRG